MVGRIPFLRLSSVILLLDACVIACGTRPMEVTVLNGIRKNPHGTESNKSFLQQERIECSSWGVANVEEPLFTSESGGLLVLKGKEDPQMRFIALKNDQGCHLQCGVRCKNKVGECNQNTTPERGFATSMIGGLKFSNAKTPLRVAVIGLGCGMLTDWLMANIPHVNLHGVDIDQDVIKASIHYFGVPSSIVVHQDGCQYIQQQEASSLDAIFLDAFNTQDSWPQCFLEESFMRAVSEKLAPGGILIGNVFSDFEDQVQTSARSVFQSMKSGTSDPNANLIYVFGNHLPEATQQDSSYSDINTWFQAANFVDVDV